uniref:Uncharacterized protein n=1 Tax=Knipowitschia caucasica TaxID=637954 RepID=A0AAV2KCT0_KNICA
MSSDHRRVHSRSIIHITLHHSHGSPAPHAKAPLRADECGVPSRLWGEKEAKNQAQVAGFDQGHFHKFVEGRGSGKMMLLGLVVFAQSERPLISEIVKSID